MYLGWLRRRRENSEAQTDKVRQRYTKVPHHAHHPHHPHHPYQNPPPKRNKKENQTRKYFSAARKKERDKAQTKYYSAIESPEKVLQHYTKPPQDIVVYLQSPRRRR